MHKARKFSTVFGTVLPNNPITMRPASWPSMVTSKKTLDVMEISASAAAQVNTAAAAAKANTMDFVCMVGWWAEVSVARRGWC